MFYFLGFGLHRGVSPVMPAPTAQTFQLTFARERNHCPLAPQSLARCALALLTPLSWPWTDPRPPSESGWCTGAEGSSDARPFRSLTFPVYPSTAAPIDPEDTRSLTDVAVVSHNTQRSCWREGDEISSCNTYRITKLQIYYTKNTP